VHYRQPTMKSYILAIVLAAFWANTDGQYINKTGGKTIAGSVDCFDSKDETIYDYSFETIDGKKNVSLKDYKGTTLLIANVASF